MPPFAREALPLDAHSFDAKTRKDMELTWSRAAMACVCAVLIAGCGGSKNDSKTSASTAATTATGSSTTSTSGQTSTVPASTDSTTTPEGALKKLWHQLQIGSIPTAARSYDSRIASRLGSRILIGGLRNISGQFAKNTPTIERMTDTSVGKLIEVSRPVLIKKKPSKLSFSYLLRKPPGKKGYVVAYDSQLAQGIMSYVRDSEQRKIDAGAKKPSPLAIQRAKSAVGKYDELFAPR
jgi:hypothetical protein